MGHGHEARRGKRTTEKAEMNTVEYIAGCVTDKLYKDMLKFVKHFRSIHTYWDYTT
jgi:hypothetical protein